MLYLLATPMHQFFLSFLELDRPDNGRCKLQLHMTSTSPDVKLSVTLRLLLASRNSGGGDEASKYRFPMQLVRMYLLETRSLRSRASESSFGTSAMQSSQVASTATTCFSRDARNGGGIEAAADDEGDADHVVTEEDLNGLLRMCSELQRQAQKLRAELFASEW